MTPPSARRYGLKAGDTFTVTSPLLRKDGSNLWTFQVVGVMKSLEKGDNDNLIVGNYSYFDEERTANKSTYTFMLVSIANPADSVRLSNEIDHRFQNSGTPTRTVSERAAFESGLQSLGDVHSFIVAVIGGVMFMLLFLTANTLMQAVRERTPEFAVMNTLGFTQRAVFVLVTAESVVLCALGAGLGLALSVSATPLVAGPNIPHHTGVSWLTLAQGLAAAFIVGGISCVMPLLRLRRMSVIDVLAGR